MRIKTLFAYRIFPYFILQRKQSQLLYFIHIYQYLKMFKVIAQKESLTAQEEKKLLQQMDDTAEINPSSFSKDLRQYQQNQKVKSFFQKFPFESIEIILKSLSIEQSLDFVDGRIQEEQSANLRVLTKVAKVLPQAKFMDALSLSQKISTIQKQLVIIKLTAYNFIKGESFERVSLMLPQFIRLQAFIIEKYLQLKDKSSKKAQDYIETDFKIVNKCQQWLADSIKTMLNSLPSLQNCDSKISQSIMTCLGDLYSALLQGIRQENLKIEILQSIIQEEDNYFCKNFTIEQIRSKFLNRLHINGFQNPVAKLQIKEVYLPDVPFDTVAFCYLSLRFAKNPTYDNNYKMSLLMPALSQIAARPYKFKKQIMKQIKNIVKGQGYQISSGYEWNYPLQLAYFNIFNFEHKFYIDVLKLIKFSEMRIFLNAMVDLKKIRIQNYEVQKETYIIYQIKREKLWQDKRCLILFKMLEFNGTNEKLHENILDNLENYYEAHKSLHSTKELFMQRILTNAKSYPMVAQRLRQIMTK